jgi:hypothetical protein
MFTNIDEFRAQIASGKRSIRTDYPEYEGGENAEGGLAFFTDLFLTGINSQRVVVEYTYPKDRNVLGKLGECLSIERPIW